MENGDVVLFVLFIICCAAIALERYDAIFHDSELPSSDWTPLPGDLVFSSGSASAMFLTSTWTHVGIVIHLKNEPYVFEIHPRDRTPTLRKVTVGSWAAYRKSKKPIDNRTLCEAVYHLRYCRYEHSYWKAWANRLVGWILPVPDNKGSLGSYRQAYCSTLVCRVATAVHMIEEDQAQLPCDMARLSWKPETWGALQCCGRGQGFNGNVVTAKKHPNATATNSPMGSHHTCADQHDRDPGQA